MTASVALWYAAKQKYFCCLNQPTAQRTLDPNQRLWCVSQVLYMVSIHPTSWSALTHQTANFSFSNSFKNTFYIVLLNGGNKPGDTWWRLCLVLLGLFGYFLFYIGLFSHVFNCSFTSCFCSFPLVWLSARHLSVFKCSHLYLSIEPFPVSCGFFFQFLLFVRFCASSLLVQRVKAHVLWSLFPLWLLSQNTCCH